MLIVSLLAGLFRVIFDPVAGYRLRRAPRVLSAFAQDIFIDGPERERTQRWNHELEERRQREQQRSAQPSR